MSAISDKYQQLGGASGFLGQPTGSEKPTPDGRGRYHHYQHGSIYWTNTSGAHEVHGAIRDLWSSQLWERGLLGYPLTDETPVADGRFNRFEHGHIYWNPATGAHEVHGAILDRYLADGGPASAGYGFPTSDEEPVRRGRRSRFQRADVFWNGGSAYVVYPGPQPSTRDPKVAGRWEIAPFGSGVVGVHVALLHTNQVLFVNFREPDNPAAPPEPALHAVSAVLDLASGTLLHPSYEGPLPELENVFCGTHAFLPDGRLIVLGGDREGYVRPTPVKSIHEFVPGGPGGGHWHYLGDMRKPRWYPSATTLPDGRVLVAGGHSRNDKAPPEANNTFEVYDRATGLGPETGVIDILELGSALYPFLVVLPDKTALVHGGTRTQFLDLQTFQVRPGHLEAAPRPDRASRTYGVEGTAALLPLRPTSNPPYRASVLMIGGGGPEGGISAPATASCEILDTAAAQRQWRLTAPMAHARVMPDCVLLPDGTVFVSNGGSRGQSDNSASPVFDAEIFDPRTEKWTTMANAVVPRLYHATAILLPDGRVMTSGTDGSWNPPPYNVGELRLELFSPPYLFAGPRPTVADAPLGVQYNQTFQIETPDAQQVDEVVIVRCSSVTHSFNFNQRFVELKVVSRTGTAVTAQAPPDGYVAPGGIYLLFVLKDGVPSIGRYLQIAPIAGFRTLDPAEIEAMGLLNRFHTSIPPMVNAKHWQTWMTAPAPAPRRELDLTRPYEEPELLSRDVPLAPD
ncbi:MAG: hypothetical protein QOG60_2209 [Frankiaceae bacterium]|nr:hypothetical protein [Frankiaceae bacterium]